MESTTVWATGPPKVGPPVGHGAWGTHDADPAPLAAAVAWNVPSKACRRPATTPADHQPWPSPPQSEARQPHPGATLPALTARTREAAHLRFGVNLPPCRRTTREPQAIFSLPAAAKRSG